MAPQTPVTYSALARRPDLAISSRTTKKSPESTKKDIAVLFRAAFPSEVRPKREKDVDPVIARIDKADSKASKWLARWCNKETRYGYWRKPITCYVFKKKLRDGLDELYLAVAPGKTKVYVSDGISQSVAEPFRYYMGGVNGISAAVYFMKGILAANRITT